MTSAKATPLTMFKTWIVTVGANNVPGTKDNRMLTADKMMVSETLHLLSAHSP